MREDSNANPTLREGDHNLGDFVTMTSDMYKRDFDVGWALWLRHNGDIDQLANLFGEGSLQFKVAGEEALEVKDGDGDEADDEGDDDGTDHLDAERGSSTTLFEADVYEMSSCMWVIHEVGFGVLCLIHGALPFCVACSIVLCPLKEAVLRSIVGRLHD